MNKMNFVKTTSAETADKLIKEGFTLLENSNGVFTFLNNSAFHFSEKPEGLVYTNIACL